jgi:M6 family metalloprotease-like protein
MPMPFFDQEFVFTQPDGSKFKAIGSGNQYYALFKTPEGFPIVKDPETNFYHYARLNEARSELLSSALRVGLDDPRQADLPRDLQLNTLEMGESAVVASGLPPSRSRWETRRAERRGDVETPGMKFAPPSRTTVGNYVGLCLLVQFSDVPGSITRAQVEAFCNKRGYNGFGNNGSVCDYYRENSDGKFIYTNLVAPYYTAKHPRSYYVDPSIPHRGRAKELVTESLENLSKIAFDTSSLTVDDQDHVYAVNVFYAGVCENEWSEGLWPHQSWLNEPYLLAPGRQAYDYQITDLGSELSLGTFCHENGHMVCTFPDLYPYLDKSGKPDPVERVGRFCLMSQGGLPPQHKNPAQICAYLKNDAGWTSAAVTPAAGAMTSLRSGRNEFAIYRGTEQKEYFILENRERFGRDAGLPDQGLTIWHVDEKGSNAKKASASQRDECVLIQADGRKDFKQPLYRAGSGHCLSATTTPNSKWWDGTNSGFDILKIAAGGQHTISLLSGGEAGRTLSQEDSVVDAVGLEPPLAKT